MKMSEEKRQIDVSKELNIRPGTIHKVWNKYLDTGSTDDRPRTGRPSKTTERIRRILCRKSSMNPFLSSAEINEQLSMTNRISNRTVRRILRDGGLFSFKAARKQKLSKINVKRRKTFCKDYSKWTINDWKKVIFSDECRIHRYSNCRQLVRRPLCTRFKKRYTIKTVKYNGFSVHIWGAIWGDGFRSIIKCPQRLNSQGYQSVIEEGLIPFYKPYNIFQQDGATCHTSKTTIDYIDSQNVLNLSDWPPTSPDLSIIENVWAFLKDKVGKRKAKNCDELWQIIQDEWNKIPSSYIENLYESIPRRLKMIQRNKGQYGKY